MRTSSGDHAQQERPWWNVMCLTGVDYFSTLGYQPGIAFLAAGILSPLATLILVAITLFGALPVYHRVAEESPHGQGSIAMLEHLFPGWRGKVFVLVLLGFAATSFIITITLSAADATAHIVENPICPVFLQNRLVWTTLLLSLLGGVFLLGFQEVLGVAVVTVWAYLGLNAYVIYVAFQHLLNHPEKLSLWHSSLFQQFSNPFLMIGTSMMLFPQLALGLSGFETGVTVMPLVKGDRQDQPEHPAGKIRHTKYLLTTIAIIMSLLLIASSIVTTLMIEPAKFQEGGAANGRALAYLAHLYLGKNFGTIYDISTIIILWFAGASAIVGLLNLVPRYLPRFGMAPEIARARRPLTLFFTFVSITVTLLFRADVDAQAGAYATGVLMLMTSAAVAVLVTEWRQGTIFRIAYSIIAAIFIYTTIVNMLQRPEGLQIALFFITTTLAVSLFSRAIRSIELRIENVVLDDLAREFVEKAAQKGEIRLLAHRPGGTNYTTKEQDARITHSIQEAEGDFIFLEVEATNASDFIDDCLEIRGEKSGNYNILHCKSPAIPNAIAALLLHLRDTSGKLPHAYFGWTEGNPIAYIFKYIFLGEGETAPVTREILRQVEKDPARRPKIHVG